LIGNVDCEFRPVDQKWGKRLMNWASLYCDVQNRFPEDEGFDSHFAHAAGRADDPR